MLTDKEILSHASSFLLLGEYILESTLYCMEMSFQQLIWTDISVIYQAGNGKNNEKYKGGSNFKISQQ